MLFSAVYRLLGASKASFKKAKRQHRICGIHIVMGEVQIVLTSLYLT